MQFYVVVSFLCKIFKAKCLKLFSNGSAKMCVQSHMHIPKGKAVTTVGKSTESKTSSLVYAEPKVQLQYYKKTRQKQ